MQINNIDKIIKNEPNYRKKQIHKAIWQDYITNWDECTTLPINLRNELAKQTKLEIIAKITTSQDKRTCKALLTLEDKSQIETVLMQHNDRNTICISTQVGCAMGCLYCATGSLGFKRNLTVLEILEQVLFWTRFVKKQDQKINNIVFMGMGEPFLNYDNVIEAIKLINNPDYFNIGSRRISISTCGIIESIEKLSNEPLQVNLAISLHASNDETRSKLMKINKQHPIKHLLSAVDKYIAKTNRKVMFEYLLLKKINDSGQNAQELIALMNNPLYLVNLVKYNFTDQKTLSPSPKIKHFRELLENAGIKVTERYSFGDDINAACGQLANKQRSKKTIKQ